MVVLVLAIVGVAVFCFSQGYIITGVVCLMGFSKKYGWPALVFTSIALFLEGHWGAGVLPVGLIIWNVVGLRVMDGTWPWEENEADSQVPTRVPTEGSPLFDTETDSKPTPAGRCDLCNIPLASNEGKIYSAELFRKLLSDGLEPDEETITMLTDTGVSREMAVQQWSQSVSHYESDWLLCSSCSSKAEKILSTAEGN